MRFSVRTTEAHDTGRLGSMFSHGREGRELPSPVHRICSLCFCRAFAKFANPSVGVIAINWRCATAASVSYPRARLALHETRLLCSFLRLEYCTQERTLHICS